jgi:hypothetical protein
MTMIRTLLTLAAGVGVGVAGMTAAQHEAQHKGAKVTTLAARDIVEKLDGKEAKVTFQEVTLEAGQADMPHRHTGPVFGYVLEGEFESAESNWWPVTYSLSFGACRWPVAKGRVGPVPTSRGGLLESSLRRRRNRRNRPQRSVCS